MFRLVLPKLILLAQVAVAAPLWHNGDVSDNGGNNITQSGAADDFVLTAPVFLNSISFRAFSLDASFAGFHGAGWAIHLNNIDRPGSIVASGWSRSPTVVDTNTNVAFSDNGIFEVTVNIGSVYLVPGHYWLQVREAMIGSAGDLTPVFWQGSIDAKGFDQRLDFDPLTPEAGWDTGFFPGNDFNFDLYGSEVPEPSAGLLLASGIFVLLTGVRNTGRRRSSRNLF